LNKLKTSRLVNDIILFLKIENHVNINNFMTFSLMIILLISFVSSFQQNVKGQTINSELNIGTSGPDFTLVDSIKGKISKENFLGKPLFIFFTTTWCTPCQIGAQNLAKFDAEKDDNAFNVLIVFVDERETDNQFIEWKQKFGRDDWYIGKGIEMAKTYNVQFLDTKYVFDKNGIIKWTDIKPLEYSTISPILSPLI
jgi:thiol-disulfide isomerase/thioredoxin